MADLMIPGGGLTKSKLLLANANPSDVSSGKGFYSNGSKELQTGTLVERGTSQNAGGIGSGGSGSSAYIALNKIPEGIYRSNGESWAPEIRVNRSDVINYLEFVPIVIIGGAAIRLSSNIDSNYVSGVYSTGGNVPYGNSALWNQNATTNITLTLKKAGRYAFFCSNRTDSGGSTKYFTINGTRYNAPNKQVRYLNAGATCQVYCDSTAGDWAYWGFCICYLG